MHVLILGNKVSSILHVVMKQRKQLLTILINTNGRKNKCLENCIFMQVDKSSLPTFS